MAAMLAISLAFGLLVSAAKSAPSHLFTTAQISGGNTGGYGSPGLSLGSYGTNPWSGGGGAANPSPYPVHHTPSFPTQNHQSLGDYHHGVSIAGLGSGGGGKAVTLDLTEHGGSNHGGTYGGSFISSGAQGKQGGYHQLSGAEEVEEGVGKQYSDVLKAGDWAFGAGGGGGGGGGEEIHGGLSLGGDAGGYGGEQLKAGTLGGGAGWTFVGGGAGHSL